MISVKRSMKELHKLFNKLVQKYATNKVVDSYSTSDQLLPISPDSWNRVPEYGWMGDESESKMRLSLNRGHRVSSHDGKFEAVRDTTGMVRRIAMETIEENREISIRDFDNIDEYLRSLVPIKSATFDMPYGVEPNYGQNRSARFTK